jgi:hypothetical protein
MELIINAPQLVALGQKLEVVMTARQLAMVILTLMELWISMTCYYSSRTLETLACKCFT